MKIGVIGGGQLGRMMAQAGTRLGYQFMFLDPSEDPCAADLGEHLRADFDDPHALRQLSEQCDVVTFEFENVPEEAIALLESKARVFPSALALGTARDRLNEKTLFSKLNIETAPFLNIESQADIDAALATLSVPFILKTRTLGYDGKGQLRVKQPSDAKNAFELMGSVPLIAEGFVQFDHEVSQVATRSQSGEMAFYPLANNVHVEGILDISTPVTDHPLTAAAQTATQQVAEALGYVGTLAIEFFVMGDHLIANEMAPRVHNSGHWSMDATPCSQFENHIRAISDLPLGATEATQACVMLNAIGQMPPLVELAKVSGLHIHDYRKAPRSGRKVGHINLTASNPSDLEARLTSIQSLVSRA